MIIDNETSTLKKALRVLGNDGKRVSSVVWFNTKTLVGSAIIDGTEQRVVATSFLFMGNQERLKKMLPVHLHDYIVEV